MHTHLGKLKLLVVTTSLLTFGVPQESQTVAAEIVDFVAAAPRAEWSSAYLDLPFPGRDDDDRGFARVLNNVRLENGRTYNAVLQTHPRWRAHGMIVGRYSNITIPQAGAEFRAGIGFREGATESDGVYFEIWAEFPGYSGTPVSRQYHKRYSGHTDDFRLDLSRFRGRTGTIALVVNAGENSSAQDWAVWVRPRLVSLENERKLPSFVGGAVGSGRRGDQLLNPGGGKSGRLFGDVTLYLEFANVTRDVSLKIESYHNGRFVRDTHSQVRSGSSGVWYTLRRNELGLWKERVVFNGTYSGDINYTVSNVGE